MLDIAPLVVHDAQDVETALKNIGLTRDIVVEIARSAAAARADSLPVDPSGTPGMLSYIYGVRSLRLNLLKHGWRENRQGNVESTVNDEVGVQIFFQNVDVACNHFKSPRAISRKGTASRSIVSAGQGELFGFPNNASENEVLGRTPTVWVICVSVEGFSVRAEVSCPKNFEGCQFEDFHQRIFVLDENFEPTIDDHRDSDDSYEEFDVEISKK